LLFDRFANLLLLRRKKPIVKEPPSKRTNPSLAAIPQTPDAPIPSLARNDIDMEDAGGQFGSMPEANPMTEAMSNDVVQSEKASDSFQGQMTDALAGAARFGGRNNLRLSTLSPARKMPAISYPAVFLLL
jgi:hypothetical protein